VHAAQPKKQFQREAEEILAEKKKGSGDKPPKKLKGERPVRKVTWGSGQRGERGKGNPPYVETRGGGTLTTPGCGKKRPMLGPFRHLREGEKR